MAVVVEAVSNLKNADEETVGRPEPILDSIVRYARGQYHADP